MSINSHQNDLKISARWYRLLICSMIHRVWVNWYGGLSHRVFRNCAPRLEVSKITWLSAAWGSDLKKPGILVWLSSTRRRSWGRALGQKWDLPQLGWCLDFKQTDPVSWLLKNTSFQVREMLVTTTWLPKNSLKMWMIGSKKNRTRKSENIIHHYKMTCLEVGDEHTVTPRNPEAK